MEQFFSSLQKRWPDIQTALGDHIQLTLISLFIAIVVAVPLGIFLSRHKRFAETVIGVTAIIQTIPSLALLGFMIPILGIGFVPAIVALTIYGLLPIVRNTFTGLVGVDRVSTEAGVGMGMTTTQVLFMVEIPLALPVIMAGIRTAAVLNIGVATLASMIGAGGLGDLIFRGIAMSSTELILAGAIPAAILALIFDYMLKLLENKVTPKGIRN